MAMKACPYRKDFYAKLGSPVDVMMAELQEWLSALEKIVAQILAFLPQYSSASAPLIYTTHQVPP